MRTLLHMPLDPACRAIRLLMAEKGLPAQLMEKRPWADEDGSLAALNPAGAVPVLLDEPPTGGEIAVSPASAIIEYLEEAYASEPLLPATSAGRAEARRLCERLQLEFEPFEIVAEGLLVWRYLGGPWEAVARVGFGA